MACHYLHIFQHDMPPLCHHLEGISSLRGKQPGSIEVAGAAPLHNQGVGAAVRAFTLQNAVIKGDLAAIRKRVLAQFTDVWQGIALSDSIMQMYCLPI